MSFNILYEETPDGIDLRQEKFLSQAKIILDLEAEDLSVEITSSNYPDLYPNSADITWLIKVPDNFLVSLTVIDLEIEECCDRLIVYDGQNTQSSVLGELTGTIVPNNAIESSSNFLFLRFSSDCSLSQRGFRAIARAVSDSTEPTNEQPTTSYAWITPPNNGSNTCNGIEYLYVYPYNHYQITSPGYPWYANYLYCQWRLQTAYSDYIVQLAVLEIQLECCGDFVDVYDGSSPYYPRLARLTNQSQTLYSSGRYMCIRFTTDDSGTSRGFRLQYTATAQSPTTTSSQSACTGLESLVANPYSSTYLSSPGYPYSYDNSLSCEWRITSAYSNNVVQLEVLDIDLEVCCDYVDVYDGLSSSYSRLVRLTNQKETVYSSGQYMYLQFKTDSSVTRKGFRFSYLATTPPTASEYTTGMAGNDAACSPYGVHLELYSGSGYITSTNYPSYYFPNSNCSWFIHGHYSSYVVQLRTQDFSLGSGDSLHIYDGSSTFHPLLRVLTGTWANVEVKSTGMNMYITFASNSAYQARGFQLLYQAVLSSAEPTTAVPETGNSNITDPACINGWHINLYPGNVGYISSPNYPSTYYPNSNCSWSIHGQYTSYVVRLQGIDFALNSGDRVTIYDGSSSSYPIIRSLTGNWYGLTVESTGRNMFITFITDSNFENRGFNFRYETVVSSPTASVPVHQETTVSSQATCPYGTSYLNSRPEYFLYLDSPGYPNRYGTYLDCHWEIRNVYSNYVVQITINSFITEYGSDYLRVYDGSSNLSRLIVSLTGTRYGTYHYYSTGNYMFLTFTTNGVTTSYDQGFTLGYKSYYKSEYPTTSAPVPEETTHSSSGATCLSGIVHLNSNHNYRYLFSPGHPDNVYGRNLECRWVIHNAYIGYAVELNVFVLQLEYGNDYLLVYDGASTTSRLIVALTGTQTGSFYSTGYDMFLLFSTNSVTTSSEQGFQLSYKSSYRSDSPTASAPANELTTAQNAPNVTSPVYASTPATPPTNGNYSCNGGVLYASTSYVYTFSSPGYPDNHLAYLDCNWKISTYSNYHIIQLSIVVIDLYYSGDYIRVYDGPDSSSPLLLELNSNSQRIVYSTGTQMVVNFKTAYYSSKKGFQASYAALYRVNCRDAVQENTQNALDKFN